MIGIRRLRAELGIGGLPADGAANREVGQTIALVHRGGRNDGPELESGSAFDHEANPLQFAPQLPPQLCWRLADHQHHPPRVQRWVSR